MLNETVKWVTHELRHLLCDILQIPAERPSSLTLVLSPILVGLGTRATRHSTDRKAYCILPKKLHLPK